MIFLYLLIDLMIIAGPAFLSFSKPVFFYKNIREYLLSFAFVGSLFIVWDYFATKLGHWSFNPEYILGVKFYGLPIEEILFFFVASYSCLFVWECVNTFYKKQQLSEKTANLIILCLSCVFLLGLFVLPNEYFLEKGYALIALSATFLTFLALWFSKLHLEKNYYIFLLYCFGLFFIFNLVLTTVPVVLYSSEAITGIRIITIPIEDFLFNFSMLSFFLIVYEFFKSKLK